MKLGDIVREIPGQESHADANVEILSLAYDSRRVRPGSLFFAISGEKADGHDYIPAARAAGAACFIKKGHAAGEKLFAAQPGPALIEVDEPLQALGDLAGYWRRRFTMKVVAITGSNGKTSTKEMAACIIGQKFRTIKNPGNFNNLIGLPLSLFQLDADVHYVYVSQQA